MPPPIPSSSSSPTPLPTEQIPAKVRDEGRGGFPAVVRELRPRFADGSQQARVAGGRSHALAPRQSPHRPIRQQIHRHVLENIQYRLSRHHRIAAEKGKKIVFDERWSFLKLWDFWSIKLRFRPNPFLL